jgi:acyl-CoA dehydrogenase
MLTDLRYLPPIINGTSRVCFGVTEPNSGLDTLSLQTTARREGNKYLVNGQKMSVPSVRAKTELLTASSSWITNAQAATRMVLLARTTPADKVKKPGEGLSLFFADLRRGKESGQVTLNKIPKLGGRSVDANMVRVSAHCSASAS